MIRIRSLRALGTALTLGLCAAAPARADVDLWPLFETSEQGTTVLYPLYVKEKSFVMVFPAYTRTNQGRDHHLFWPLLKVSDGHVDRLAPLWYSDQPGDYTIFPLIRKSPSYTLTLIPPMYTAADGSQRTIFPFYSESREQRGDTLETRLSVLWPIYTRSQTIDAGAAILEQKRSFLFFSESREASGRRRLSFFGVPFSERIE